MKKTVIFILVLFFLFVSFSQAELECTLTEGPCSGEMEEIVLCLSDSTNAHAELPQKIGNTQRCPTYDWKVCCKGASSTQCSGQFEIPLKLQDITNSHGAIEGDSYSVPVCLAGLRETKCDTSPFPSSTCLVALSDSTNAHFAGCDQDYGTKIYCNVVSDGDGDGFDANSDCNDNDPEIYPGAVEIGDGVDNDCDGLLDGDDPGLSDLPLGWYQASAAADAELFKGYTSGGIVRQQLPSGKGFFSVTSSGKKGIVSRKIQIDQNTDYVASVKSTCPATLQLVYDDAVAAKDKGKWWLLGFGKKLLDSTSGDGVLVVEKNSGTGKVASIFITVEGMGCEISEPLLERKGKVVPTEYNDIIEPITLPVQDTLVLPASACCAQDTCWNGFTCVDDMSEQTFLVENVSGNAAYRCVDGFWQFQAFLYDWNRDKQGSCPQPGQCFVLEKAAGATLTAQPEDFYSNAVPICIDDGKYLFDNYCNNGTWTSRTRFVAEELLKTVESSDEYVLYCDSPEAALVSLDEQEATLLGNVIGVTDTSAEKTLLPGKTPQQLRACFDLPNSAAGLLEPQENTCINNVCVLKYTSGGEPTFAVATTLNTPLADPLHSIGTVLGLTPEQIAAACDVDTSGFAACDFSSLTGFTDSVYYSPTLNALIYSKESLSFEPSPWQKLILFFKNFFSSTQDSHKILFSNETTLLRDLYLLNIGNKQVTAVKEAYSEDKATLLAEYTGFKTPVCEFIAHLQPQSGMGVLSQVIKGNQIICTLEDGTQKVVALEHVDLLWPQLTGRLRTLDE